MTNMSCLGGMATMREWERVRSSSEFSEIERFSNAFLRDNADIVDIYSRYWPADPLHTWSRIWEYPYVLACIDVYQQKTNMRTSIVDAGSGVTFFPYFVAQRYPLAEIVCMDVNLSFAELHKSLAARTKTSLRFVGSDLARMDIQDDSVDILYCVSVLEHLEDWEKVISEFDRVLRKNGCLIVTLDIALDGRGKIPPFDAEKLVNRIEESFRGVLGSSHKDLRSETSRSGLMTMRSVWRREDRLVPDCFARPSLHTTLLSLSRLKLPTNPMPNLAVYGGYFLK
jgi:SAM-dependent methyltransferase